MIELVQNIGAAITVGATWGIANYFYNAKKYGDKFQYSKFIPSLIVYAGVGTIFYLVGIGENLELFNFFAPTFAASEGSRFIYKFVEQYFPKGNEEGD